MDTLVDERRYGAVLARAQALKPGLPRMDDEAAAARGAHLPHEVPEEVRGVLVVDADAALHRNGDGDGIGHGLQDVGDKIGPQHQRRPEPAVLHPVRGAAAVEVYFVVALLLRPFRAESEILRIAPGELHGDRMLCPVKGEVVVLPVDDRTACHHFGVQKGLLRHDPPEAAAVAVSPVEHRGSTEAERGKIRHVGTSLGKRLGF